MNRTKRFTAAVFASLLINGLVVLLLGVSSPLKVVPTQPKFAAPLKSVPIAPEPERPLPARKIATLPSKGKDKTGAKTAETNKKSLALPPKKGGQRVKSRAEQHKPHNRPEQKRLQPPAPKPPARKASIKPVPKASTKRLVVKPPKLSQRNPLAPNSGGTGHKAVKPSAPPHPPGAAAQKAKRMYKKQPHPARPALKGRSGEPSANRPVGGREERHLSSGRRPVGASPARPALQGGAAPHENAPKTGQETPGSMASQSAKAKGQHSPGHAPDAQRQPKKIIQGEILPPSDPTMESRPTLDTNTDFNHFNGHLPRLPAHVEPNPASIPGGLTPKPVPVVTLPPLPFIGSTSQQGMVPVSVTEPTPPIKPARFPGDGTGLLGRYYFGVSFQRLAFERADRNIEFEWTNSSPDPVRLPPGNAYAVQWHGGLIPRYTETYTIYTAADDGARVWIDGKLVIDDWSIHSVAEDSVTMPMEAGRMYDLRVEYFEKNGRSVEIIKMYWESLHQPREFIPQSQLRFPPD